MNTETPVLDVPMLRVIDEDPTFDHDLFLALLEPRAEQKSRERREARMRRRTRKKRRKKKLPKASSGHGRPCDHATPVPAVFAAREREGASDSVHRQTLELPAAPQRQVRTVQTVQLLGDSTVQFLGEVVDGPVVATTGAGDGPDSADSGGSTAAAPGLVCGLACCCARQGLSSELFSDKVADVPFLLVQTVQMQFLDKVIDVPVAVQQHVPKVVETVQFLDKVIDVPVAVQQHVPKVVETVQFLDKVIDVPVAVQRHVPKVVETVQFLDQVIDVPVAVQRHVPKVSRPYSSWTRMLTCPCCARQMLMAVQTEHFLDKC